jgi:repressor LexA
MIMVRRNKGLSERHNKIIELLEKYQEHQKYPSIREICEETGISSTSVVNYYLDQLEQWGYIERDRRISRGVRLVKTAEGISQTDKLVDVAQRVSNALDELFHIPLMGRIVASEPVPVPPSDFNYFDSESGIDIARSLLPSREKASELYALEVQGESMIDAMVNDGDIVIMKRAQEAHNGEMVAVWLRDRDETTLKYFYLENGRVRLQPANPTMKPIYIEDPSIVQIQGKVVMVIRKVDTVAA